MKALVCLFFLSLTPLMASLGIPSPSSPTGAVSETRPTFTWSAVSGADYYRLNLQKRNSSGTYQLLWEVTSPTNSYTPVGHFAEGDALRWTVRAQDNSGGVGTWSSLVYFVVDMPDLSAPSLYAPLGTVTTNRPTLSWSQKPDAEAYRVNVQRRSGSSWVLHFEHVVSSTGYTLTSGEAMVEGVDYRWNVRAEASGLYGPWAPQTYFDYEQPDLSAPSTGCPEGDIGASRPTFSWSQKPDADRYRLNLKRRSGSSWVLHFETVVSGAGTTSYTPTSAQALSAGSEYQWTVRAEVGSQVGPWAPARFLTYNAYGTPMTVSPSGAITSTTPTYSWSTISGADRYRVNVAQQSANGSWTLFFETTTTSTSLPTPSGKSLTAGVSYRWNVRAEADCQSGGWSPFKYFNKPEETVPGAVTGLVMSPQGTTGPTHVTSATPTFSWDAVPGATHYWVNLTHFNRTTGQWMVQYEISNWTQNTYTTPDDATHRLVDGEYYHVSVRAANGAGSGTWAGTPNFYYYYARNIAKVTLASPAHNSVTQTIRPTFQWNAVTDVTRYRFNIDSAALEEPYEILREGAGNTSFTLPFDMEEGVPYTWTVRGEFGPTGAYGVWATPRTLTYQAPVSLGTPTPQTPIGSITDPSPHFGWTAVSGASSYAFELQGNGILPIADTSPTAGLDLLEILDPGTYQWRVRAAHNGLFGAWTGWTSFTVLETAGMVLSPTGLVVADPLPMLRLPGNASFPSGTVLRRYQDGELGATLSYTRSQNNQVLEPDAGLSQGEVYRIEVGASVYHLAYDPGHQISHINPVAYGAAPYAPAGNPGAAVNNMFVFRDVLNVLSGVSGSVSIDMNKLNNPVMQVPRGRWMLGEVNSVKTRLTLGDNVTLRGYDAQDTVLVSDSNSMTSGAWEESLVLVSGMAASVENLTILGLYDEPASPPAPNPSSYTYFQKDDGIRITGDDADLVAVTLKYLSLAITPVGCDDAYISGVHTAYTYKGIEAVLTNGTVVSECTIDHTDSQGILFGESGGMANADAVVIDSLFSHTLHRGIHMGETNGALLINNTIRRDTGGLLSAGILANGSNLVIVGNTIEDAYFGGHAQSNYGAGIKLENGCNNVVVAGNMVTDSQYDGVSLSAKNSNIAVVDNTISGGLRGIHLRSGTYSDGSCPLNPLSPFPGNSTAISGVYLVDNEISGISGPASTTHFTCGAFTCGASFQCATGDPAFAAIAQANTGRAISIHQNPYFVDNSLYVGSTQIADDVSGVLIGGSAYYLGAVLIDTHVGGLSLVDTSGSGAIEASEWASEKPAGQTVSISRVETNGTVSSVPQSVNGNTDAMQALLGTLLTYWNQTFPTIVEGKVYLQGLYNQY